MIIFIVPKNNGLKKWALMASEINSKAKVIEMRGEDIPEIVSKFLKEKKKAIGITGEDLFKEYLLKSFDKTIKELKRILWLDESFLFKKPTLCLLGPKDKKFEELPKRLRVCINTKYKNIAKKYFLNFYENKGYIFDKIYLYGSTEELFNEEIVDIVIDVVCSGESARKVGLGVYKPLFYSDIVIIGDKNERF